MEFSGDVARKRGPYDRLAIEAAKTSAAAGVGARTGLFHVPAVLRCDAAAGLLETERVHGFVSLLELVLRRDPRLLGICERVGRAIAAVHADVRLADELRIPLPAPLAGDRCVLRGELNGTNVGIDPDTDRVVIVDGSAAQAPGGGVPERIRRGVGLVLRERAARVPRPRPDLPYQRPARGASAARPRNPRPSLSLLAPARRATLGEVPRLRYRSRIASARE